MESYESVLRRNVAAYDAVVAERATGTIASWKLDEHEQFAERLLESARWRIVEVGAGTGFHSRLFADAGFDVIATDPSAAMVAHCRSIGLETLVADVLSLSLDVPVDAVFAMNSLLHVPAAAFPDALRALRRVIRPGGLVYIGMYGGLDQEGCLENDHYVPKRWFVSHSDERLVEMAAGEFQTVDFHQVDVGDADGFHFQSLTLLHR